MYSVHEYRFPYLHCNNKLYYGKFTINKIGKHKVPLKNPCNNQIKYTCISICSQNFHFKLVFKKKKPLQQFTKYHCKWLDKLELSQGKLTRAVQEQTASFGEVSCGYFLEHELVSRDVPVSRGFPCIPFSQDREINQLFCTAFASALVDRGK